MPDLPQPPTRVEPVTEVLHGHEITDPYRWLEDDASPEVPAWVAAQNHATRVTLDALPGQDRLRARLDELLTAGSVGTPRQRGPERFFYARRDGRQDQPVLLVRQGLHGSERVLLDPNTMGRGGLVALDWWEPSHDGRLIAYGLSAGGDEMSTLHVLDVDSGANLPGEEIPHTRACSVAWLPDGSGFYYTRYPEPGSVPEGEENYHRHVFRHTLGARWREDAEVFGPGRAREDWPGVDLSEDGRWLLVIVSEGWARSEVYLRDEHNPSAGFVPVHAGVEAWVDGEFGGDQLYLRSNEGAPNYQVYQVNPEQPARAEWRLLIPEQPDRVLSGFTTAAGLLAVEEMANATSRLVLYGPDGTPGREVALPALGSLGGLHGEWHGQHILFGFTSFAQPSTAYRLDPESTTVEEFAHGDLPPGFDPSRYQVRQVWYASPDGTRVSMFLVHRPDLVLDGTNPTLLTGYGGFNVSLTPAFDSTLPLWLDAGGVLARPNLRGGGEYGEAWHQAGMLGNKQNVFDDFIAAAEWLIAERITSPHRLAISGGSNGGLLVGAALTQRPDLFAAVVCRVPLLDMLRYHHLRIARLWIAEYGSAEDATQFEWLLAYSPYHRVREGERYPATFLLTAEGDSRVDPMHARKMAARLQAANAADTPILLRVESAAGHGAGKPRAKVLDEQTDIWSFIAWRLGVTFA